MAQMIYSKTGLVLTESSESCSLVAYQDVKGVWTIGYGHTGPGVVKGLTCDQQQAELWLQGDITWAEYVVNQNVKITLTQNEFDSLVDFVFNVGSAAFTGSSLLRFLNQNNLPAAAEQFELWDHASGKVVAGLLRRRIAEEKLFTEDQNASAS